MGTGTDTGPVQVQAVVEVVLGELAGAFPTTLVTGSSAQWAAALGSLQQVIDTASAIQDAVIARLAAIEPVVLEDGTIAETHRALGHAALDTPAIVSGVLNVAPAHAESRVRAALALAADGPAGTATATGLGALHTAMATGRLDTYRAAVVAAELAEAPPQVAATVVAALEGHFGGEDAAHLRRRCRRVLARISPDLLVQRARRARQESGLRRWADEPGVDKWMGTFPSEDAAAAWAAIDTLAHQYRNEGLCATIERARAKALTDLVAGHATIDTTVTVTIPATALTGAIEGDLVEGTHAGAANPAGEGDLVEVTGPHGAQPVYVARSWLTATISDGAAVQVAPCHPATGALLDDIYLLDDTTATDTAAGGTQEAAAAEATQTGDLGDHPPANHRGHDVTKAHHDDDAHAHGTDATADSPRSSSPVSSDLAGPYRPTRPMATRIKTRDRRCRFPGCTISAVFCDIDHVRPWPHGPTRDTNLLSLCRRHHRIKQRLRWRLTLTPDGIATWTDPTGRTRTTHPTNALHTSVLPDVTHPPTHTAAAGTATSTSQARTLLPDAPHSALEFHLEHHTAPPPGHTPTPATSWRDHHGRHRTEIQPISGVTLRQPTPHPTHEDTTTDTGATEHWPCRRTRRPARPHDHDPPPF